MNTLLHTIITNLQPPQILFLSRAPQPHCTQNCKTLQVMHLDDIVLKD